MAAAYQLGGYLEEIEADERDPARLEKLYQIDNANSRIRRQAENLQVLAGRKVEDAGQQVTTLLDVVRASVSAIEHYPRVKLGGVADLAVVEFAADDVIRLLTELVDNAARFSAPRTDVVVSAHVTERGSVLLRIEDTGIGIRPERLAALNAVLAGEADPLQAPQPAVQLGLAVVQRLARAHRIQVRLTNRNGAGTTATILLPEELLCAIPLNAAGPGQRGAQAVPAEAAARTNLYVDPAHRGVPPAGYAEPLRPGGHAEPAVGHAEPAATRRPPVPAGSAAPAGAPGDLPVRVVASLRNPPGGAGTAQPVPVAPTDHGTWPDETADFAAGVFDAQRAAGLGEDGRAGGPVDAERAGGVPAPGGWSR